MKRRILSLFLVMTLFLTISGNTVMAEEGNLSAGPSYSQWAFQDLVVGDTYDIYPQSWYYGSMEKPITNAQLRVLMAGIRGKLINTDSILDYEDVRFNLTNNMTVEKVLNTLYTLVDTYEFDGDVGIVDGGNAVDYMTKNGVYTGNEGELSLKDLCTVEQACVMATRLVTYLYDALDVASKGFLWEINSGENTVYLLGSIHLANYDIYPFSNTMLKAFVESDVLGVEVDVVNITEEVTNLYIQYGMYSDGSSLKDHVSEETYQKAIMLGMAYGLSEEVISMMKPWYLFSSFTALTTTSSGSEEEAALAASLGIDMKFLVDAYLTGKPVVELEGFELQLKMLDSFSDELAEYLLSDTLDTVIAMAEGVDVGSVDLVDVLLYYWHKGDVEGFMKDIAPLLVTSELPDMSEDDKEILELMDEYYSKIFTDRDKGMADKIDEFLKAEGSTTYFVVVGSGHYISDYSVLDMLEEMGYEINQIK